MALDFTVTLFSFVLCYHSYTCYFTVNEPRDYEKYYIFPRLCLCFTPSILKMADID